MTSQPVFKKIFASLQLTMLAFVLCAPLAGHAQMFQESYDWKEGETPPPPAYDTARLLTFKVNANPSVVYGVDPASISISRIDSVVRYVMVATSASGNRNVIYEGLRCATGEFKTYARQTGGQWNPVSSPEWRSVFDQMPSPHPLVFAKAGACDGRAPAGTVAEIEGKLKTQRQYMDY
ncbi:MAG: CNP1-like family protein [Pseudomonadota bacterium]